MRLFIALLPDENVKQALADAQNELRRRNISGHCAPKHNLHLTLCFIGEYSDPDRVLELMEQIRFEPFDITLAGYISHFDEVLWAGIEKSPELEKYVKQLRHVLAENGIPFDRKGFEPHITLMRDADVFQPFSDIVVEKETMTVSTISLMRSDLGKHGAQYTEIGTAESIE